LKKRREREVSLFGRAAPVYLREKWGLGDIQKSTKDLRRRLRYGLSRK